MILRSLYYSIPTSARLLARRLYYLPKDVIDPLPGLSPPRGMIYTGGSGATFAQDGVNSVDLLQTYANLTSTSAVLDIGSGIGRVAIPLTKVLEGSGSYRGFDVVATGVEWCTRYISSTHPNFEFRLVALENDLYTASGGDASEFVFPYADEQFTTAAAFSVFTHMLPEEVVRYLRETARVLAPGGEFLCTAFLLDAMSTSSMGADGGFVFAHDYGNYALLDESVKSANVAYDTAWLRAEIAKAGLVVKTILRGRWSGQPADHPAAFQDVLVLLRPPA